MFFLFGWSGLQDNRAYVVTNWCYHSQFPWCMLAVVLVIWIVPMTPYFCHIYGNNLWSICCIWLCFGTHMHQSCSYIPIQNEGRVNYMCNVAVIFFIHISWLHQCSLQKYVYNVPGLMVDAVDLYVVHRCTYIPPICTWNILHVYVQCSVHISSGTYTTMICETVVAVGCVLAYIFTYVAWMSPYRMRVV